MNILIDCTNLKVGGGIQVATSFINDLNKTHSKFIFFIVLSHQMRVGFKTDSFNPNIRFIDMNPKFQNKRKISGFLKQVEEEFNIDKVFCVFGPSFYKSKVPKIVGYAIPHFIYEESPFFKKISIKKKINLFFRKIILIHLFKRNSDALIFETDDARIKFTKKYNYSKKTYTVNNALNEVFMDKNKWNEIEIKDNREFKILTLSANYPHKNLMIIPKIIEILKSKRITNFSFLISLNENDINITDSIRPYINFIGKVELSQLPKLYEKVDFVFIPTLLEVFSATYIEAMHMQKPIVASDMSFARDICKNAALYFIPTDSVDASNKIVRLMKDKNLNRRLAQEGLVNLKRFGNSFVRSKEYLKILSE